MEEKEILIVMPSTDAKRCGPQVETDRVDCAYVPLSVISLAGHLEAKGYKVRVLDTRAYSADQARRLMLEALDGVWLVGFSVMTASIREALDLSDMVKSINGEIIIVWGGVHATLFPEQTIADKNIDFVVAGEGEIPFSRLLERLESGEGHFEDICNVGSKRDGRIFFERRMEFIDINSLPLPAYHLLDIEKYICKSHFDGKVKKSLEIQTSRGCPNRCTFCINTIASGRRWREQEPDKAIRNIQKMIENYSLDHIFLMDENFFPNIKRAEKIIKFFKTVPVTWEATCRADYFRDSMINDSILAMMRDSGCKMLRIGVETGSEKMRRVIKKDVTEEDVLRAVSKCVEYNIQPMISYMLGMPGELRVDMIETVKLISKLQRIAPRMIHSGPQIFRPYPGGELYESCVESGYYEPKTLREWHDLNPNDFSAYKKYPWLNNQSFLLDMITALSCVDKENNRVWPMTPDLGHLASHLKKIVGKIANKRYEKGYWDYMLEFRAARTLYNLFFRKR